MPSSRLASTIGSTALHLVRLNCDGCWKRDAHFVDRYDHFETVYVRLDKFRAGIGPRGNMNSTPAILRAGSIATFGVTTFVTTDETA
jgi:hypothetical protein